MFKSYRKLKRHALQNIQSITQCNKNQLPITFQKLTHSINFKSEFIGVHSYGWKEQLNQLVQLNE